MSGIETERSNGAESSQRRSIVVHFLWQQLPYIVALGLAIAGVAYTNASHQPLIRYWEFLALAIGVVCVINKWPEIDGKQARMNIMLVSGVQQLLPTPATSLVLLILLALGTFLAGISLLSLQIAFLGLAMGLAVPAISWLQQSVIFFLLGAVLLIGLGITFWLSQAPRPRATPAGSKSQMEA
jgi:hypothetical protein